MSHATMHSVYTNWGNRIVTIRILNYEMENLGSKCRTGLMFSEKLYL